jgi:phospholipid-binding lipoprotein MlaA
MNVLFRIVIAVVFALWFSSVAAGENERGKETSFPDLLSEEVPVVAEQEASYPDLLSDDQFETNGGREKVLLSDPLEPMNRVFFEFNDLFHDWVLKPVNDVYSLILPEELRKCFGNFFINLAMPVRLLNTTLQGEFGDAGIVLGRFLINSTLGIYGLVDVAEEHWGIERRRADFGQTLGRWGMGEGIYLCWPFLGPSNVRDSLGFIVDVYSHPVPYLHDSTAIDVSYLATSRVNAFSLNPDLYDDLRDFALDPYIASRQAYFEYRRNFIARQTR